MYSRFLTGYSALMNQVYQYVFPCIPFLQNSRQSKEFFNEAKRRPNILLLILIVNTNIVNVTSKGYLSG